MAPGPHAWSPGETRDTNWGAILGDIPQISGLLSAIFRLIEAHRNEIQAQPRLRRLPHLTPAAVLPERAASAGYDWARTGRNANPRALVAKQLLPYCFAWPQTDAAAFISTIELVDPELRDALALWPLLPLTAESLMRRRADAFELIAAVPKPNPPDIATDEIHVESAFAQIVVARC